jgi:RimJ/RimL family protein N-acetyltransferase
MIDSHLELAGYGITLRRLTQDKIEMVRQWRNDLKIRQYMLYQETITPEMQNKWFEKINNDNNLYFIVQYDGNEVGLIDVKDIDYKNSVGEGGIFIYDEELQNTDLAYRSHILLFDYVFNEIGLERISSEIQPTNIRAIRFATFLGCEKISETPECLYYMLSKENYFNNKNRERFLKRWNYHNNK